MHPDSTRRSFLIASAGLLAAGCASTTSTTRLPDIPWKNRPTNDPASSGGRDWTADARGGNTGGQPAPVQSTSSSMSGVMPRSQWSTGSPIANRLNPLTGVNRLTIHHDGMSPFYSTASGDAAARMDLIRRAHQGQGWGDIGYHFVVDPAGRVWEGRSLHYQGAHVKYNNEGNIGIMCMGNFEQQSPSAAQVQAMVAHVRRLQVAFRIPASRVYTHQELASTACPGRALQAQIVQVRRMGNLG